jgi:ATP-dependent Zn protease
MNKKNVIGFATLLGGRSAEQLIFGKVSTGAGMISTATKLVFTPYTVNRVNGL